MDATAVVVYEVYPSARSELVVVAQTPSITMLNTTHPPYTYQVYEVNLCKTGVPYEVLVLIGFRVGRWLFAGWLLVSPCVAHASPVQSAQQQAVIV